MNMTKLSTLQRHVTREFRPNLEKIIGYGKNKLERGML